MLRHLSAAILCFEKRAVFRKRSSRKTVNHEKQIMSKNKYPREFSRQMEVTVFIILQLFFVAYALLKLGNITQIFRRFSWGISSHVTRSHQSHESENIRWIIILSISRNPCMYQPQRSFQCIQEQTPPLCLWLDPARKGKVENKSFQIIMKES